MVNVLYRYQSVTADSTWDVTTNGQRYYYPAQGVGDYVVPVPTATDQFKQWLSAGNLGMNGKATLNTPVNVIMTFWQRQTVTHVRINQAAYDGTAAFHTKAFNVYLRTTGGSWVKVGS